METISVPQQSLFSADRNSEDDTPKWKKHLKKYKFSQSIIEGVITKNYATSFIEETLKHCENYFKNNQIANKEGFILKALEKGYYGDLISEQEEKAKKTKKATDEKETESGLQNAFQEYLNGEVEKAISGLPSEQVEELKNAFLSSLENNTFFKTALNAYGFDHQIIQAKRKMYLREELLSEEQRSIEYFQKRLT